MIERTITHRLVDLQSSVDDLAADITDIKSMLTRLIDMLDPDGPTNAAMHHDLESILSSIGQAVLTPMAREAKG